MATVGVKGLYTISRLVCSLQSSGRLNSDNTQRTLVDIFLSPSCQWLRHIGLYFVYIWLHTYLRLGRSVWHLWVTSMA